MAIFGVDNPISVKLLEIFKTIWLACFEFLEFNVHCCHCKLEAEKLDIS